MTLFGLLFASLFYKMRTATYCVGGLPMASKSMFKLLTAVMFFLNTHVAWGQGQPAAPASGGSSVGVTIPANGDGLKDYVADQKELRKEERCKQAKDELRKAEEEREKNCTESGFSDCIQNIESCEEIIKGSASSRKKKSYNSSALGNLLATQLGVSASALNTATLSNNKKANSCPQLSGKTYLNQEKRIEDKITSIQDKIKTTQEKITEAMNKSTEKQEDFNKKSEDLQKDKDEAEEDLSEEKKKARDDQLEQQREAAENLNKMKKQMTDLTKKIKAANTELSAADSAYRRKQTEILSKSEQKQSCMMQTNASLQKLKEAFATSNGSATKRTKELEAAMQTTYRMCMRKMENEIQKEKEEYQTKLQNLNDTIVSSQEEMKQLQEQIKNAEGFDTQAQTNIETRNKELEAERDKKVNRANTALTAAQQNLLTQLQNLSSTVSQNEQSLKELQAKLVEAENEKARLMAIAPSTEDVLVTAESSKSPGEAAKDLGRLNENYIKALNNVNSACGSELKPDRTSTRVKDIKESR